MRHIRTLSTSATVTSLVLAIGIGQALLGKPTAAQTTQPARGGVPVFEVDAAWPKPLPNKWIIGEVSGLFVDARDHVWLVHRQGTLTAAEKAATTIPPTAECCVPAPAVVEFDPQGNVVQAWGGGSGSGYEWPPREHGISLDHKGNVWVSSSGNKGTYILKFTQTGKFLLQIGEPGKNGGNNDTATLGGPAQMRFDDRTNEVFVADGEANRRVIVFDADTGAYKRHWGAYGERPDDATPPKYDPSAPPSRQFGVGVHCIISDNKGLLYVCDRVNDRFQIFRKDGTFVKEMFIAKQTLGVGSVFDINFSPDKKFLYVADGTNEKVWILLRDQLQIVGSFGRAGRNAGQFLELHDIAVDSKGNIYTGEANASGGKRVQKFIFKGLRYSSGGCTTAGDLQKFPPGAINQSARARHETRKCLLGIFGQHWRDCRVEEDSTSGS